MTTKSEKMLEKVRALLAKADGTDYPAEAETFRAKADQLMAAYAIEQWQVDQARDGQESTVKPEVRYFNFDWWYDHAQSSPLWTLFYDTARHCRCVVALRGHGSAGTSYRTMPVIGLSSDLDYLDLMFTHLMIQMSKKLTPNVDTALSPGENVYNLRMAGMGWKEITRRMWDAGLAKPLRKGVATSRWDHAESRYVEHTEQHEPGDPFSELSEAYWTGVKNNLANLNRKHVKDNGLPRNYVAPAVYQRSYAEGFVSEINRRFREMRDAQLRAEPAGSGMELALRDIREQALDLYEEMWPQPEEKGRRRSRALSKERAYSYEAAAHGREAGRQADLANKASDRIGSRRALDR